MNDQPVAAVDEPVHDVNSSVRPDVWPELTLDDWADTRDTLHMWTQIAGKVRLALEPMVNHWWQVPLYVSARGLTTSLMHAGTRGVEMEFDFGDHVLHIATTDGAHRRIALAPRSVASFFEETMTTLDSLDLQVSLFPRPVEVPVAIPFADDEEHHSYDAAAARRFWQALVHVDRVLNTFRARFIGKASPVQFFWGSFDLATSRFSGRRAPKHPGGVPNCPDWVQHLAYSHELSSCGFWPGGSAEGSFFAYAYPTPNGFRDGPVAPSSAFFDEDLGEFLLPYSAVRTAADPDETLLAFVQSAYEAGAERAGWDRAELEATA
jgi:hypothetical protein